MAHTTPPDVTAAINLRLALLGQPLAGQDADERSSDLVGPIIKRQREFSRRLGHRLCAADRRIQEFVDDYLADTDAHPQLPNRTLVLDAPGLARALSLPHDGDEFSSELLSSYRLANGVLHNPANDRRTTAGVFHVAEGGLPIPDDKLAVPREVFGRLLELAFQPPEQDMVLPFTADDAEPAACFVSLLLRPLVVPAVPGFTAERTMETRFIVPGGLVANLDFVEGIFGNGGDPHLPENDASLDPEGWTGTTGAVILAPHLTRVTKQELGLPHVSEATNRQRRDGMCWESEDECYNGGQAFKVCARDERGVIVTVIADNYFGYCKKEVKTQISYSANLFGLAEEEHSGGALAFPAYNLGRSGPTPTPPRTTPSPTWWAATRSASSCRRAAGPPTGSSPTWCWCPGAPATRCASSGSAGPTPTARRAPRSCSTASPTWHRTATGCTPSHVTPTPPSGT